MESKDKPIITFHSGILTIGGTVIEVAYKDAHIFFDFGTEFRPELNLPDDNLSTLLENRLVPELKDLYDPRLGYQYQGADDQAYQHTAVFLSHAHLDHSRMINYLDPAVPLYTLKETKAILNTLNRTGDFLIPSPFEEVGFTREMIGLEPHDVIEVGDLSVEIVPVDHDAYGASALLIRTPDQLITYTGDLRLHGHNAEDTLAFCEQAKASDLLMMEGVSISFPEREGTEEDKVLSEEDLIQRFVQLVLANPHRQITFNGYPANVKRFAKIIEQSPRTVVLEANMAALLLEIFDIAVPYYYLENALVIDQLDATLEVAYDTLLVDQERYVWQVVDRFENLQEGSLYIHSDAQPLGDFDPQYAVFLELLAQKNITFVRLACTGHAFPDDLAKIISLIQPKLLVPIHTLHPEKLENPYGERILPDRGSSITL
ncbi:MBL fold metallo-hydrolase [Enterococcus saccharolyticus]|uniref:MBL fold metallo-hydrolase n=1 Tax=Enterococcus saccharolyticus TaxID=41997 RepID=UPI001E3601E0|nr:MBL fold metallo-hydrolase [Enterococcus saccharolyticus]MCD5002518.1 MBL fold metallo-hydrolase [Enterococcus saccharolyticus]